MFTVSGRSGAIDRYFDRIRIDDHLGWLHVEPNVDVKFTPSARFAHKSHVLKLGHTIFHIGDVIFHLGVGVFTISRRYGHSGSLGHVRHVLHVDTKRRTEVFFGSQKLRQFRTSHVRIVRLVEFRLHRGQLFTFFNHYLTSTKSNLTIQITTTHFFK